MGEVLGDLLKLILMNYSFYLIKFVVNQRRIEELIKDFLKQLYHKLIVHKQYIKIKQ
jgi:hypothetical protein